MRFLVHLVTVAVELWCCRKCVQVALWLTLLLMSSLRISEEI
jgi:hypothetical protein